MSPTHPTTPSQTGHTRLDWILCLMLMTGMLLLSVPTLAVWADDSIEARQARLAESVKYLSSDDLQGRGLDTAGIQQAAEFVATEFSNLGLDTELVEGGPYQRFDVTTAAELGPSEQNRLALVGPPTNDGSPIRIEFELQKQFNPLALGGSGAVHAPVVFVGYGITAKEQNYDDYANLDVEGKVVLMLRKEPQQDNPHSAFDGNRPSRHATFNSKVANAYEHGAAAVILVNDDFDCRKAASRAQQQWEEALDELAKQRAEFKEHDDAADDVVREHRQQMEKLVDQLARLKEQLAGDFDTILPLHGAGQTSSQRKMPVMFAKRASVDRAVKVALGMGLAEIEAKIDQGPEPSSRELAGWVANCETSVIHNKASVANVIAVLEGEGPLADETVVVGAHYDHLGMGGPGSLAPWTKAIHNGADDNASGTAALLEIAHTLASRPMKPSRRIVFIAFAGEERGLLGSAHYAKNPVFPIETTVAMVNMDMVGRLKNNKLIVHGTGTATEFDGMIDQLNQAHKFDIKKEPGGFGPSDHATFYGKNIPVFHFFTGTHNDYHRPSDDFEKINLEGMHRIAGLVTDVVDRISETKQRPEYQEIKRRPRPQGDRPYFGSIPDFGQEVEGYALMGVTKDSPAAKAGLKAGDVIIKLGESRIGGLEDFDSALRKYKAGDKVKTTVKRNGEELELVVTLGKPR